MTVGRPMLAIMGSKTVMDRASLAAAGASKEPTDRRDSNAQEPSISSC